MGSPSETPRQLPGADQIRLAVELYLARAYPGGAPAPAREFLVPEHARAEEWLMNALTERDPPDAPLSEVRSFVLRIGNEQYPHMKVRISCPPLERSYLFSVDAHDACLQVPPTSPDYAPLEELKRYNARLVAAVTAAWDAASLPTERNYLRWKIAQSKGKRTQPE
ncbi:MAG: hypothetical protein NTV86_07790 [Planctomycetota bacterium]|nr:hypothetical protein [Planctomycetota bacterium]